MLKTRELVAVAATAMVISLLVPVAALPCGPGVHIRESDSIWPALAEQYPNLKYLQDDPMFETYLHLGAIMPDFQWFLPIKQGHSSSFSLYLIEHSLDAEPRFLITALGHLMHNSVSDPLCEQFWTPTLMASAPLGMVYLLEGYGDAHGMSEGVTEVLGDLLVGDWDALIDLVFDIYLGGEEAETRGHEMITWYVNEMNAYYATYTDPEVVWQSLVDKVSEYEMYIIGLDRQSAKDLFNELKGDTPAETMAFFTGDLIADLAGDAAARCEEFDTNIGPIMESALTEQWFWDIYGDTLLSDLTSFWYVDRVEPFAGEMSAEDVGDAVLGWPTWGRNPMISGNIMSTMQFLPDLYDVVPGIIVDDVVWMDGNGSAISVVTPTTLQQTLKLRVTYYSAYDFSGDVRLVVKNDMPGLDQSGDAIVGEHTESVTIDPRGYVNGARSTIETTFQPGAAMIDGFYFELYAKDGNGPCFTSNWDSIMASGKVPVYQKIYRDNFATYGKWPPSLPLSAELLPANCDFFVTARTFGAGGPVYKATVSLIPGDVQDLTVEARTIATSENGMAVFDLVSPGTYSIVAEAPVGFVAPEIDTVYMECAPETARQVWSTQEFHVIPRVWVNNGISGRNDCIVFETNSTEFFGKVDKFLVTVTNAVDAETILLPQTEKAARPKIEACFPSPVENGTSVAIHIVPRYINDLGLGIEGVSDPILIDSTAPVIDSFDFSADAETCADGTSVFPFRVNLYVTAQSSPIDKVEWSKGDDVWTALDFTSDPGEIPYTSRISVSFDAGSFQVGDDMLFRVTNTVGIQGETFTEIPASLGCPIVAEPVPDTTGHDDVIVADPGRDTAGEISTQEDVVDTDEGFVADDGDEHHDGGCSAGNDGGGPAGIVLLALAAVGMLVYRRRGVRT